MTPRALSLSFIALAMTACRREPSPPSTRAAASTSAALPLDSLLPDELAEGKEQALGLLLPRDLRVLRNFRDSVVARGRVTPEALTDYVRKRVSASAVETSLERTTFPRVHVNGTAPDRQVKIAIVRDVEATMLFVDDITPPQQVPGLSEEERWRRAGVNPKDPLDPTKL
jgi:hypothetical protein